MKNDGDSMFCLSASKIDGVYNGERIRRLTEIECERLTGLPDNYTADVPSSHRYRLIGNAVGVNVARALGKKILESMKEIR